MSGIQVHGFSEETVLLLNELGKTKLSYHWKAKKKKNALFIYEGVESSSKALGHSSGMEGFWTEVVLRAGGTFCQAKREASSDKCYPGNSPLLFFPRQKCQDDLHHLYKSEDKLSLPLQAELCQTHCGVILTHLYSVLILEVERKNQSAIASSFASLATLGEI